MKKKLILVIAAIMALSVMLVACGNLANSVETPKFSIEVKDNSGKVIAILNEETVKSLIPYEKTMKTIKNDVESTYVFRGYLLKDVLTAAKVTTAFDVYEFTAAKSANPKPLTTEEKEDWFIALWTKDLEGNLVALGDDGPVRAFNSKHTSTSKWCKNLDTITLKTK